MATIIKTNSVVAIGKEIFYTAGRNVNECNHYDNQYGFELRFLKKLKIELCAPTIVLLRILCIQEL